MSNIISSTIKTIKNWWVFLLTGILLIAGSLYVLYTPKESYVALSWLFSILVTANGLSNIYFSVSNRKELQGWGWYLTSGILELIFGIILFSYPNMTMIIFPIFIGFWLLFRGIQTIGASLELKEYGILDWGWLMLLGVAITVFATFMVFFPIFGYFNIIYLTSISLLLSGFANISISLQLKKIKSKTIDKVEAFKKGIKKEFKNLKKDIVKAYENASAEDKKEIDEAFDTYENIVNQ